MRRVTIKPAINGWIVSVGCGTVVFEDMGKMLTEVGKYIQNPLDVEKEYQKNAVNKDCQEPQMEQPVEASGRETSESSSDTRR